MLLSNMKKFAAKAHKKTVAELTEDDLDLFLAAANNVRKEAERKHNFEYSRVRAELTIVGASGGDLDGEGLTIPEGFSSIKEVVGVSRINQGGLYYPVDFTHQSIAMERERWAQELDNATDMRYPSDADLTSGAATTGIVQLGRKLYVHPYSLQATDVGDVTVQLDVQAWLEDYTEDDLSSDEPINFIDRDCGDWLLWAIILDLNYIFETYVPRTEGNLTPPEKRVQELWNSVVEWDSHLIDSHITRSR